MSPFLKSSIGFQFCANIKLKRILTLLRLSSRNMWFNLILSIFNNSLGSGVVLPLAITFCVYCVLGFRSRVLSHVPKRNIKTKLQIYTSPQHVINTLLCAGFQFRNLCFTKCLISSGTSIKRSVKRLVNSVLILS